MRLLNMGYVEKFQSTLPAGEATHQRIRRRKSHRNFNPRFPRGKRPSSQFFIFLALNFNPRFPRGKRPAREDNAFASPGFQSTLPAGEATLRQAFQLQKLYISIHASRGGSDVSSVFIRFLQVISIHASRGGSDIKALLRMAGMTISIHASRGGSDKFFEKFIFQSCYFNPRFPRGKRPPWMLALFSCSSFQSTLPAGEATVGSCRNILRCVISIHASRGGSDQCKH